MSQSIIPAPPGKTSNFENPQDALHTVNLATQILCISVTTVVVTLRFIVRIRIHKTFTLEDCMYSAWPCVKLHQTDSLGLLQMPPALHMPSSWAFAPACLSVSLPPTPLCKQNTEV